MAYFGNEYYLVEIIKKTYVPNVKYDVKHLYYTENEKIRNSREGLFTRRLSVIFDGSASNPIVYMSNDLNDCYNHLEILLNIDKYNL